MPPEERTASARKAAATRWIESRKDTKMVTCFRTRLTTAAEQQGGAGPFFKRKVVYALSPDNVKTLLRAALAEGNASITSDDLVAHSMSRLREEALRAVVDDDTLKRTFVRADPDPTGDRLAQEHHTHVGEEVRVVRKSFGVRPGFGMTTQEEPVRYRVPSRAALRERLMKAMKAGAIEPGGVAALDAGRLLEGVLLKAMPEARRVDGGFDLMKAAAELEELVERNTRTDEENFERRMR